MKKTVLLLCFFCIFVSLIAEENMLLEQLNKIFPSSIASELLEKGTMQRVVYREKDPEYLYYLRTPLGEESIQKRKESKSVTFFIEALYLYKKKINTKPGADIEHISQILRSLSTLEGIEYFSSSKNRMRILYEKSYVIDSPELKNKISDPIIGNANDKMIYAIQKDSTFGEHIYQYTYRQTENEVAFFSTNKDALYYLLFKVIDPHGLYMSLLIDDIGDALVVYATVQADFIGLPGIEKKLTSSFSNRADALYNWFLSNYRGVSQ